MKARHIFQFAKRYQLVIAVRHVFLSLPAQPPGAASLRLHLCQPLSECEGVGLPQQRSSSPQPGGPGQRGDAGLHRCGEHQYCEIPSMSHTASKNHMSLLAHHLNGLPVGLQSEAGVREFHIIQVSSSSQHWRLHKCINPAKDKGEGALCASLFVGTRWETQPHSQ